MEHHSGPREGTPTTFSATKESLNSLPNEIVVEIICCHQEQSLQKPLGWLSVTHICRHWRAIALSTPKLWTTIIIGEQTRSATVAAFLARSRGARLTVISDIPPIYTHEFCVLSESVIRDHSTRVSCFDGCVTAIGFANNSIFPVLEHLRIKAHNPDGIHEVASLDCSRFPSLRSLRLNGVHSPAAYQLSHSLVYLEVTFNQRFDSVDSLLDLLEPLVLLEGLTVSCSLPLGSGQPLASRRTVPLDHLHILTLQEEPSSLSSILSQLTFPTSTSVHIDIELPESWYINMDAPLLPHVIPRDNIGSLALTLASVENVSLTLSGFGFTLKADAQEPSPGRSLFHLRARCIKALFEGRTVILPELGQLLAMTHVTNLQLSGGPEDGELVTGIEALLAGCSRLRHLTTPYNIALPLGAALNTQPSDDDTPPFPALKDLTLFPDAVEEVEDSLERGLMSVLLDTLRSRALKGFMLEQLTIRKPHDVMEWDDGIVEEMRRNVGTFNVEAV